MGMGLDAIVMMMGDGGPWLWARSPSSPGRNTTIATLTVPDGPGGESGVAALDLAALIVADEWVNVSEPASSFVGARLVGGRLEISAANHTIDPITGSVSVTARRAGLDATWSVDFITTPAP